MEDIILSEENFKTSTSDEQSTLAGSASVAEAKKAENELIKARDCELNAHKNKEIAPKKVTKRKKPARTLTIFSIIFTALSLPCALIGFVPLQALFIVLGLVFYIVDRKKNGKRGISLFGMVCTLVTFVVIFVTLVYSFILLGIGIYTVYVNPEPYNFVMGTFKGLISWFLGIFGINFNF